MSAPRVLYDTSALGDARRDAGIGRYTAALLAALRGRPDVVVRALPPGAPPRSESRPYRWLRSQPALWRAARPGAIDLVHAPGGEPALTVGALRQVVSVHDAELWRAPLPGGPAGAALRVHRAVVANRLRRCTALIVPSPVIADEVCAALGIDRSRVHVVPLGVAPTFGAAPTAAGRDALAASGVSPGGYLLWAGSMRHHDPRKALDVLLEAVARLGPGAPPLVLAGATGAESDRLTGEARRRHLDVRVVGRRDDVALTALYRNAAVCVLPSLHEGFGLTLLEAMAAGAPVVATDGGNLPALGGGAAVIVPAGDAAALAGAIAGLLEDPQRRAELGRAGVERAAAYTWERCAAETVAVYRWAAGQQVASRR